MAEPLQRQFAASPSPPLSRRARKKERTRAEIYGAAMKLFLRRGYGAVTVEDICRAADVARGTFFLHFPTKESLLYEYGARANEELAALLARHRGSAGAALRLALKSLVERARRQPDVVALLVREVGALAPTLAEHERQTRTLVELLAGVVGRGQESGEFRRRVAPEIVAVALGSAFFALVYEWTRRRGALDIDGAISQALDVVLNGLGQPKAAHPEDTGAARTRL